MATVVRLGLALAHEWSTSSNTGFLKKEEVGDDAGAAAGPLTGAELGALAVGATAGAFKGQYAETVVGKPAAVKYEAQVVVKFCRFSEKIN